MPTRKFSRFRMEIDLNKVALPVIQLPPAYRWQPWIPAHLERHALAKWMSFREELDSQVFPCLGNLAGCRRLMGEITRQKSFVPGATWLLVYQPDPFAPSEDCGVIQGVHRNRRLGAIQNVGIVPQHRNMGLGRALVLQCLHGFQETGTQRVLLEVTAENRAAVNLYRSIGFRVIKTMLKAVEVVDLATA